MRRAYALRMVEAGESAAQPCKVLVGDAREGAEPGRLRANDGTGGGPRRDITSTRTQLIYVICIADARNIYRLPGLRAGVASRSGGRLLGSKVSTCKEIRLNIGTPNLTVPPERSMAMATPTTTPAWARMMSMVS